MKKSKKQLIKNAKGITLVALVVTIVMMLILVGITMVAVLGDNGVISKAKIAGNKYEKAEIDEIQYLNELSNLMHNYISKDNSESSNKYKFTIRFEDNDKNLVKFEMVQQMMKVMRKVYTFRREYIGCLLKLHQVDIINLVM